METTGDTVTTDRAVHSTAVRLYYSHSGVQGPGTIPGKFDMQYVVDGILMYVMDIDVTAPTASSFEISHATKSGAVATSTGSYSVTSIGGNLTTSATVTGSTTSAATSSKKSSAATCLEMDRPMWTLLGLLGTYLLTLWS